MSEILEKVVTSAILTNAGLVGYGMLDHQHEHVLEIGHSALLTFFAVEIVVRIVRSKKPWRDGWLVADAVIITLALLPAIGVGATVLRLARLARTAHLMKHVAGLQMLRLVR